jgi:cytochrome c biogenesis protein
MYLASTNKGFINSLWNFFCSLKLTIFLLIGLAAASIIGTVIPQNAPLAEYQKYYSEATIRIFDTLNFMNMYHSWWFILLLYLLTLNLVACSLKRLPRDWKIFTEPTLVMDENMEKSMSLVQHLKLPGNPEKIRENMESFLRREFAAPVVTDRDGKFWLFAQKDIYSRLGVYVLHFSIIIIFVGAMIGSYFGFKAYVSIEEGSQSSVVYKRPPAGRMETPEMLSKLAVDLGFDVRCDNFTVSYYDNGAPKEYKSILSIIDNGKPVIDKRPVIVNSPLTYKGITFYQSSYSPAGDPVFHLTARDRKSGTEKKITAKQGEQILLPDGSSMQVIEYTEDIRPFIPQASGPAVRVELTPKSGQPQFFLLLKNYPDLDMQRGGDLIFTYDSVDQKWMTGLQVTKDPGVWLVWLGCFMLIVGTFIAFFMSHKRIWVRIEGNRVSISGASSKNQPAFQQLFDRLVEKLKAV